MICHMRVVWHFSLAPVSHVEIPVRHANNASTQQNQQYKFVNFQEEEEEEGAKSTEEGDWVWYRRGLQE